MCYRTNGLFTEKFGEAINWVDYSDSILEILNKIQDKDGELIMALLKEIATTPYKGSTITRN